jgi:arabinofuranan 3-O-arabinosyltransferase
MGPYYWVMERLGVPDWLAQRLWLGTLVFAAGAGVLWLARVIGLPRAAALPMAVAYAFGPYVLHYAARISAILLPWAGLPWMIGCAALALRTPGWRGGGWKWPARFALVVALVGSVNATSLLLAGLGPVLWIVAEVVDRRVGWRAALGTAARIGLLTAAVSTWWIAGLWAQGRYGVPILRYTETYEAVAGASSSTELLRGLGYWFFYGGDRVSQWVEPSEPYLSSLPLIALGFAIAAVALTGLARGPLPRRRSFVLMLVVGLGVAVGAHPLSSPSAWGRFFEVFVETTSGQAMRSTPRAAPLYALALAAGIGAVVAWAAARVPRRATIVSAGAVVVLAAQLPALFTGDVLTSSLLRDESVPEHWQQATAAMDDGDDATRVYETPGSDFAYYRWGGTVDPITPGLIERPYVARQLVPYGGAGTADLLNALEDQLQVGVLDPAALADLARLLGVGTIATRNDL